MYGTMNLKFVREIQGPLKSEKHNMYFA